MKGNIQSKPFWAAVMICLCMSPGLGRQEEQWEELNARLARLHQERKISEAMEVARQALRIAETTFGQKDERLGASLNNLATMLFAAGSYAEAEPLFRRALAIWEQTLDPKDPYMSILLGNLGSACQYQGKYPEAQTFFDRALEIAEAVLGPEDLQVAELLNNQGGLCLDLEQSAKAEPFLRRSLVIREKILGPDHPLVAASLTSLAVAFMDQGRNDEAEPLLRRGLAIREKALGPDHPDVSHSLRNLARLCSDQGRYAEAESLFRRSLAILEKSLGPEHPQVVRSLSDLGQVCQEQGRYGEAEALYRRCLAAREKNLGSDNADVAQSLNDLATLCCDQGRNAEAELFLRRSLAIYERTRGADKPDAAAVLNNLAAVCRRLSKPAEAEALWRRSLDIREKTLGPEHRDVAVSLNNLAKFYGDQEKYAQAEPLLRRSLAIWETALGPDHPDLAASLNILAEIYRKQGRFAEAEPLLRRGLAILEKALGPDHPNTGAALQNYAALYYAWQQPEAAASFFTRSLENLSRQLEYHFTYMSEKDRLEFLDAVSASFPLFYSFAFSFRENRPALVGQMYDVALWQKGFVAQSLAALRSRIIAGGDAEALALLDLLAAKKNQLAKLLLTESKDSAPRPQRLEQLEEEANALEQNLIKRSATLSEEKRLMKATWRDVQKSLKEGEAAVEILRFDFHNGRRWTDKSYYVALIVTPQTTQWPDLVVIGEAAALESSSLLTFYELLVSPRGLPASQSKTILNSLYAACWRPLEAALDDVRRVYLSPDGILNLWAWNVLPLADSRCLLEARDLRLVINTKDLLREQWTAPHPAAVLIGNPEFDLSEESLRAVAKRLGSNLQSVSLRTADERGMRSREGGNEAVPRLPGTQQEVEAVAARLRQENWQVNFYCGSDAVEEAIKQVRSPRVLHAATHGFFLPDQGASLWDSFSDFPSGREDPMLRSGLLFSGGGRTLAGNPPAADLEDGVFTAYEAASLNLQGTELVVLSACETGLGKVKNGEGVFGLRRAFQIAGAESVLMSLWSVPDKETLELMTLFYAKWMAGQDKHDALRAAQRELRARVQNHYGADLPYYWGAFVLVGR